MTAREDAERARRDETRRRARIVRRYVTLARPSADDDRSHAEELGLSVDSLLRLAQSWRQHGRADVLRGGRVQPGADAKTLALAAAEQMDLSGVSPSRRAETRRRIELIRDYLRPDAPTQEDLANAAAAAGMTPSSFKELVRRWLLYRDAAALPGAVVRTKMPKRLARPLSDGTEKAIQAALAELGSDCTSLALHRRATEICERDGHRPPNKVTAYYRLLRSREGRPSQSPASLAIDHVAVAMAVQGPGGAQLAVLSVAFARPSGRIIAHSLSLDPPDAKRTAELLLAVIGRAHAAAANGGAKLPLELSLPDGVEWDALLDALHKTGVELLGSSDRRLRAGRLMTREFGELVAGLRMRPGYTTRPATAPLTRTPRAGAPLAWAEAQEAVDDAVARHNEGRAPGFGAIVVGPASASLKAPLKTLRG